MLTLKQPIKINVQFITWKFLDIKMTFLTPKYQINCQITNIFSVKTQHTKNSSSEHFLFLTIRYLYHMLDYIINPPFFVLTYFIIIFILEKYLTLNFSFFFFKTVDNSDERPSKSHLCSWFRKNGFGIFALLCYSRIGKHIFFNYLTRRSF